MKDGARDMEPKQSVSRKFEIANKIRDDILGGVLPLGSKISEQSLSDKFKCSRTPVREGLLALQAEGLVSIKPQSGTYVFNPTIEEIGEICEARAELECVAVRLILMKQKDETLDVLKSILEETEKLAPDDVGRYHDLDIRFHNALINGSYNRNIVAAYTLISGKMIALRQLLPNTKRRIRRAVDDHEEILECISAGDDRQASQLIYGHISTVQAMLSAPRRRF